jgi:hypothetical protein
MKLSDLGNLIPQALEEAVNELGEFGIQQARSANLFKASDAFKANIKSNPINKFELEVESHSPHSYWLEEGNNQKGAYIYPVNGKVLRFQVGGKTVFAKKVRAHGPLPFMSNAKDEVEKKYVEIVEKHLNGIIK